MHTPAVRSRLLVPAIAYFIGAAFSLAVWVGLGKLVTHMSEAVNAYRPGSAAQLVKIDPPFLEGRSSFDPQQHGGDRTVIRVPPRP